MPLFIRYLPIVLFVVACARGPVPPSERPLMGAGEERQPYEQVRSVLDQGGAFLDYDALMDIYKILRYAEKPVVHMDQLLFDLVEKRNSDRRLDQMIIILAVDIVGNSKYPIARVSALFDKILDMDGTRIDNWVLIFVAEALGYYPIDLPDGDRLADRVAARVAQAKNSYDPSAERFGQHFLPPPKRRAIIDHIAGIQDQQTRQRERNAYYFLFLGQHSEAEIEAGLGYVLSHPQSATDEPAISPLVYLLQNWDLVQNAVNSDTVVSE